MKNKNSQVPPGASTTREDEQPVTLDQMTISGGQERVCPCCRTSTPVPQWITLLNMCEFCSYNCEENTCVKNKCQCPGGCCADHKDGEKCADTALLMLGKIGEVVLEICAACAIEIAKKALLS